MKLMLMIAIFLGVFLLINEIFILVFNVKTTKEERRKKRKQARREWIPVAERLPEKSGKYLVTFGGTYRIGIDFYSTEEDARRDFEESEEYIGWNSHNVIAWMPLPEPYKVDL